MIDNEDIKIVPYSDFNCVNCSQFKEFNCEQELTPIQSRLYYLMIFSQQPRGESESLYGWTARLGLSKSTTYGLFTKRNQNMHLSVAQNIAKATGANALWIQKGVGEPFDSIENQEKTNIKEKLPVSEEQNEMPEMNTDLLTQAFQTLDNALEQTKKVMPPAGRSRFITAVYDSLRTNDGIDLELLKDSIYTLEEALKLKRQVMSPISKTRLILAIYELYSGNVLYKEAIQHTINQLIGSAYEGNR
ncbi:hypothetical protein [Acinetobacter nectaris]|uniref:hypothetical protein n=1 Tax=Acinetobacter nectaris TaxID=1219382 RepID=UPI001F19B17B|nr:hypothetical protein [Acinetobacter nectaris]MCF8999260.1 hypothetical protein [Acinetobacter nectaris]MCF9028133.1 hypothetical protein [Acinetobacter nectaris]